MYDDHLLLMKINSNKYRHQKLVRQLNLQVLGSEG